MANYPAFSSFRELMSLWNDSEQIVSIKAFLENNGLILFFKKDKVLYGAPEQSRVIFARMKNPADKIDAQWAKEATFMAINLMDDDHQKVVFGFKDLDDIEIVDQEKAEKELTKKGKDMPTTPITTPTFDEE